ncbi:Bax inhibitor-1/YccA family protein [Sporichthya sp.]|uniref:Bax inhibitor-1/YccA family protein n=1 Tax=Sporichthya sp. TaxID=65475 RepID=UPI00179CEA40|nr:Bax inhibitor-1/YccA family protein [Sporichthya sp.]MBA3741648.1 Bax inhibitor-1/YccA family protein [Sporichthya sp.]
MQSSNPVLSRQDVFSRNGYATFRDDPQPAPGAISYTRAPSGPPAPPSSRPMTVDDVVARTGLLLVIAISTGVLAWAADLGFGLAIVAMLIGFGLAMVNVFKKVPSPPLIIAYAAVEGVFLGAFSHALEASRPNLEGVAIQAVAGTAIVFAVMLGLYKSGRVRVTARMQKVVLAAMLAFVGLLLFNLVFSAFGSGVDTWGGPMGVAIGAIGVCLGAFMLAMDFDLVERGVRAGAPEIEAWRAAFGLTVTVVWIYIEMLRLLSSLRGD